jgi:Domain of unknown function (DUF4383)
MSRPSYEYDPARGAGVSVDPARDALARRLAAIVGTAFLVVGVLGFVPGVTENLDQIEFAGHESGAELFGIFQVSVLHNIVHLLFGVAGLALARRASWARAFLIGGGLIYLALTVFGWAVDQSDEANFIPVNEADDWLHLGLGVGMVLFGLLTLPRRGTVDRRPPVGQRPGSAPT